MKYMSIDLETTGTVPSIHGITEFAAILGDDTEPELYANFYRWLNPEGYVWSNFCLALHAAWIGRVTTRIAAKQFDVNSKEPKICHNVVELANDFMAWYETCDPVGFSEYQLKRRANITGTGKNFGTFDLQFLKAWKFPDVVRHRTLDWIQTYQRPEDKVPPDLKLVKQRAILMGCPDLVEGVAHNALDDALDVHKLIQFGAKFRVSHQDTLTSDPRM